LDAKEIKRSRAQSRRLDAKKVLTDPILMAIILILVLFLTLFIVYPLVMMLTDAFYSKETGMTSQFFQKAIGAADFKRAFINTIELGVQSFDPKVLEASKRGHVQKDIYEACRLIKEYGFTLGTAGDCFLRQGKYYFTGLPPVVSDRLYVDVNSAGTGMANLTLIGDQTSTATGTSYLRVNSLSYCWKK